MKKIILIAATIILFGCSKEEPVVPIVTQDCKCGLILSDDVNDFSIQVRNDCSNNVKKFVLYEGDWMTAYVGSNWCTTQSW